MNWNEMSPNSWGKPHITAVTCTGCGHHWEIRTASVRQDPKALTQFHCPCGMVTIRPVKAVS